MTRASERRIAQANAEANAAAQDNVAADVIENAFDAAVAPNAVGNRYAAAAAVLAVGRNYTIEEMHLLLDCVEEVMPQGLDEWEGVHTQFHELWFLKTGHRSSRDMLSLRRCFTRLRSKQVPTGAPECPDHVRRAKRLYWAIVDETGGVGGRNVRQRVLAEPVAEEEAVAGQEAVARGNEEAPDEGSGEPDAPLPAPRASIQRGRRNHREMNEFERNLIERMERREEESRQNREVFNRFIEQQAQREDAGLTALLQRVLTQQDDLRAQIAAMAEARGPVEPASPELLQPRLVNRVARLSDASRRLHDLLDSSDSSEEEQYE